MLDPAFCKNKKCVWSRRSHKKWTLVRLKTNYRSSGRPVHHRFSDIGWGKRETLQQHQQKKLLRTTLECWCKRRSTQKDTFFQNWSFFTSSIELLFLLFFRALSFFFHTTANVVRYVWWMCLVRLTLITESNLIIWELTWKSLLGTYFWELYNQQTYLVK